MTSFVFMSERWPSAIGNPGSSYAAARGCICSPVLNFFGRGDDSGLFKISTRCPVHRQAHASDEVRCERCGEILGTIGDKTPRLACPNGCTVPEDSLHLQHEWRPTR